MEKEIKPVPRKKFLAWGLGITSVIAIPAFLRFSKSKKPTKQVKMLSQDGSLVYVDIDKIPAQKKKINKEDIHTWISKK